MTRNIITHGLCFYLGAGLFGGLLMATAIPAMNVLGVAYFAATWPMQVYCARPTSECDYGTAPAWAFDQKEPKG
jgi:hypothetical protein